MACESVPPWCRRATIIIRYHRRLHVWHDQLVKGAPPFPFHSLSHMLTPMCLCFAGGTARRERRGGSQLGSLSSLANCAAQHTRCSQRSVLDPSPRLALHASMARAPSQVAPHAQLIYIQPTRACLLPTFSIARQYQIRRILPGLRAAHCPRRD